MEDLAFHAAEQENAQRDSSLSASMNSGPATEGAAGGAKRKRTAKIISVEVGAVAATGLKACPTHKTEAGNFLVVIRHTAATDSASPSAVSHGRLLDVSAAV